MFNQDKKKINLGLKFLLTFIIIGSIFSINSNFKQNEDVEYTIGKINYNKNGETYGTHIIDSNGNSIEPELIQTIGRGKKVGYVKKEICTIVIINQRHQKKLFYIQEKEILIYLKKQSLYMIKKV